VDLDEHAQHQHLTISTSNGVVDSMKVRITPQPPPPPSRPSRLTRAPYPPACLQFAAACRTLCLASADLPPPCPRPSAISDAAAPSAGLSSPLPAHDEAPSLPQKSDLNPAAPCFLPCRCQVSSSLAAPPILPCRNHQRSILPLPN